MKALLFALVILTLSLPRCLLADLGSDSFLQCTQTVRTEAHESFYHPSAGHLCQALPALNWEICANHLLSTMTNGNSSKNSLPQMVTITSDPQPNAFLVNSDRILITSGLTSLINSGEELAFILAHELAHAMMAQCEWPSNSAVSDHDCQFVIAVSNRGSITNKFPIDFHEIRADRIALEFMRGISQIKTEPQVLLNKIAVLQVASFRQQQRQSIRERILALEEDSLPLNQTYRNFNGLG